MTAPTLRRHVPGPRIPAMLLAGAGQAASLAVASVLVARWLGPTSFGVFTFTLTLSTLLALLAGLGTGSAVRILLSRSQDEGWLGAYAVLSGLLGLALVPTVYVASWALLQNSLASGSVAAFVSAGAFCSRQAVDLLHARGKSVQAVTAAASSGLLAVAVMSVLHSTTDLTAETALLSYGACYVVPVVAVLVDRVRHPWRRDTGARRPRELLAVGLPASGMQVGLLLVQRLDRILLGVLAGPAALGLYSVAASIAEVSRVLPQAVGQVSFYRAGDPASRHTLPRTRVLTTAAVAGIAVLIGATAPTLLDLAVGPGYGSATTPLRILLVAEVLFVMTFIDSRILLGLGRQRFVGAVGLVCATAGAFLYLALISAYAAIGAAFASVIVYGLMSGLLASGLRGKRSAWK